MADPQFASPVTATYDAGAGALQLRDETTVAKLVVRSNEPQFGVAFATSRRDGSVPT